MPTLWTIGYEKLLPPALLRHFETVDLILHGGDVKAPDAEGRLQERARNLFVFGD